MTLQSLAQQQRAAILARDQALAEQISSLYSGLWQSLAHRLLKLLDDLAAAEAQADALGVPFNGLLWARNVRGLDTLLASVGLDMQTFVTSAQTLVQGQLYGTWQLGQQNALDLMRASLDDQLDIAFGRPSLRAFDVLAGRGASSAEMARYFAKLPPLAQDALRKRLMAGLALGQGPREVAASIRAGLGIPLRRALTISKAELIGAYRSAAIATYRENADVLRGWTWSAAAGACPFCLGMNGTQHPLSEELQSHLGCRCAMLPDPYSYEEILARYAA